MNFPQPNFQQNQLKKGIKEVETLNRRKQQVSIDEIISKQGSKGGLYLSNLEAALNIQLLQQKGINYVLTLGSNIKIDYRKRIKQYEHELNNKQNIKSSCSSLSSDCNESNSSGGNIDAKNSNHYNTKHNKLNNNNNKQLKITNLNIDVDDIQYSDMSTHFNRTYQFIQQGREKGSVLVHCMMGISRSATVVIAYLMQKDKLTHQQAFQIVKSKRPCVQPNRGFIRQLNELENTLKNQTTRSNYNTIDQDQDQIKKEDH